MQEEKEGEEAHRTVVIRRPMSVYSQVYIWDDDSFCVYVHVVDTLARERRKSDLCRDMISNIEPASFTSKHGRLRHEISRMSWRQ